MSQAPEPRRRIGRPPSNPDHPFARWILRSGLTREVIAERLSVSRATIDRLARGTLSPSLRLAVAIDRLTSSEIVCARWVPEFRSE